jgi:sporulation protein YlmC with PRC-barrel domain
MLRSVKDLIGYSVRAIDGDIGRTVDFYFDDDKWTIRYLVVDTETGETGSVVLLSPLAVGYADFDAQQVELTRTRDQVRSSPGRETDRPVSREWEARYFDYYRWPYYWTGPGLWGAWGTPVEAAGAPYVSPATMAALEARDDPPSENNLRSANEVIGYSVEAQDGGAGKVQDLLVDDRSWKVMHFVIDTRTWWPGGEVLIPADQAAAIDWPRKQITFDLTREDIKSRPEFRPSGFAGL